jgi:stress response protein SCP2
MSGPKHNKIGIKVGVDFKLKNNTTGLHIDFMAIMLDKEGKLISDNHFIFYNNPRINSHVKRILFFVSILDADKKNLSFELISNLRIRFTNLATNTEIAEFIPETDNYYKNSTIVFLSEFISVNDEWQISALGDCYRVKLSELIELLETNYSYDKFKHEYFKNIKSNEKHNYSVRSIIEKDLEDKFYKVLDCNKNSSDDEIKKKYKELVKSFHPDLIQSKNLHKDIIEFANNRFKEIKEAYEFLKTKRKF